MVALPDVVRGHGAAAEDLPGPAVCVDEVAGLHLVHEVEAGEAAVGRILRRVPDRFVLRLHLYRPAESVQGVGRAIAQPGDSFGAEDVPQPALDAGPDQPGPAAGLRWRWRPEAVAGPEFSQHVEAGGGPAFELLRGEVESRGQFE